MNEPTVSRATTELQLCYTIGAMPLVPHYTAKGIFVAPGGLAYSERDLQIAGARRTARHLWPRAWLAK